MANNYSGSVFTLIICCFISGIAGINYEILFFRIITTYLGDLTSIQSGVVAAFLGGIVIGSFLARKYPIPLWLMEVLTGTFALVTYFGFKSFVTMPNNPMLSGLPEFSILLSFIVTLIPAIFVGYAVPQYTWSLKSMDQGVKGQQFPIIFAIYNLGAAISVLATEFIFVRQLGHQGSLVLMVALNFATGILLLKYKTFGSRDIEPSRVSRDKIGLLILIGVLAGGFQIQFMKSAFEIFAHRREVFAIVTFLVLFGIPLSVFLKITKLSVGKIGLLIGASIFVAYICLPLFISGFSWWNKNFYEWVVAGEIIFASLFGALVFVGLGGILAAFSQHLAKDVDVDRLIGYETIGYILGIVAFNFLLYEHLNEGLRINLFIILAVVVGLWATYIGREKIKVVSAVGVTTILLSLWLINEQHLFSHRLFIERYPYGNLEVKRNDQPEYKIYRSGNQYAGIVRHQSKDGMDIQTLFYEGHSITPMLVGQQIDYPSMIMGFFPTYFKGKGADLAILGPGVAQTAGMYPKMFRSVDAIDLNYAMFKISPEFSNINDDFVKAKNVNWIHDDARVFLSKQSEKYDIIVNTVSSLRFGPSSKLSTIEFYDVIKRALKAKGIFVTYLYGPSEISFLSQVNALRRSFSDCRAVFLNGNYYAVACSESKVEISLPGENRFESISELALNSAQVNFNRRLSIFELMYRLIMPENIFDLIEDNGVISTDDMPLAEFHQRERGYFIFSQLLGKTMYSKINPLSGEPLDASQRQSFCDPIKNQYLRKLCESE